MARCYFLTLLQYYCQLHTCTAQAFFCFFPSGFVITQRFTSISAPYLEPIELHHALLQMPHDDACDWIEYTRLREQLLQFAVMNCA